MWSVVSVRAATAEGARCEAVAAPAPTENSPPAASSPVEAASAPTAVSERERISGTRSLLSLRPYGFLAGNRPMLAGDARGDGARSVDRTCGLDQSVHDRARAVARERPARICPRQL